MLAAKELKEKTLPELRKIAKELDVANASRLKKENLVVRISQNQSPTTEDGDEVRGGVLEIMPEGIGFLRQN